jgi:rhodanese-related sulfurtransferase
MSLFGFLSGAGRSESGGVKAVDAATARRWHEAEGCLFVDIREDDEFRAERIPGAQPAPLSRLERAMPGDRENTRAVFYCLSGARTQRCAPLLAAAGFAEVYVLDGGLRAWKAGGGPTTRG